jgi:uncharacterized protein
MQLSRKNIAEKEALYRQVKNILEEDENILFAYVFGSSVMHDAFHDIDIAIFLKTPNKSTALTQELDLEVRLSGALRLQVDVRILNEAPLPFRYNVLKTGRVILDRDALRRSDFESLTYRMYFDFERFRIEYLRGAKRVPFRYR